MTFDLSGEVDHVEIPQSMSSLIERAGKCEMPLFSSRSAYSRRTFLTRGEGVGCDLLGIALDSMNIRFLYEQGSI
jgi:hypothetical protein